MERQPLTSPDGVLFVPENPCGTGVLVLSGSSGRLEEQRARMLAGHGATAMSIRWFGGPGQQAGPYDVPLETFIAALDDLAARCDRLVMMGSSWGAEASLLVAAHDPRLDAVVAFAPTPVVWAGVRPDGQQTSHWTLGGEPVPFVPYVDDWEAPDDPPAYRELYAESLAAASADQLAAATIPVERITGDVVLVAGGDDQVWPAMDWAPTILDRRARHGLQTTVVTDPDAGHRTPLPRETPVSGGQTMARGGSPEADAALGHLAWPHILTALRMSRT
ncbi:acyl-CoA thioester hydrolase/BAAT C-terminal domain-containing protein [Luteipulveratus mongoliensis]|uniref:BAAT/Acyl-CoA thioester hydrolase C-terminal domain-containing protein n=1 Tax=Luteipulveratus mongoliensis TaxID=571913 RepID=A0A0K1JJQ8_9MICO|nr:acyl-CoA thioester hydrolase/BAAT C-terminal domain-containing protein [Luteipulveratus mongoliensis]AKU16952.1 hypothetical protein VV02_15610 [Luteipulveratus mongoliensis]